MILSVLAVVFTTLRSWPQFLRIIVKGERAGVSALTWAMALANHTGWFVFGLLSGVPLLIVVNIVAAAGCGATAWVLRSWAIVGAVTTASLVIPVAAFSRSDALLLAMITALSLTMFVPQVVRTVSGPDGGVYALGLDSGGGGLDDLAGLRLGDRPPVNHHRPPLHAPGLASDPGPGSRRTVRPA